MRPQENPLPHEEEAFELAAEIMQRHRDNITRVIRTYNLQRSENFNRTGYILVQDTRPELNDMLLLCEGILEDKSGEEEFTHYMSNYYGLAIPNYFNIFAIGPEPESNRKLIPRVFRLYERAIEHGEQYYEMGSRRLFSSVARPISEYHDNKPTRMLRFPHKH